MENIALDVHKKYTWARVENTQETACTSVGWRMLMERSRTLLNDGVRISCGRGDGGELVLGGREIDRRRQPQLVNARLAKLMMGNVNKSDKLDAKGMNHLQRNGTLPTVWIPPSSVRDARELRAPVWC